MKKRPIVNGRSLYTYDIDSTWKLLLKRTRIDSYVFINTFLIILYAKFFKIVGGQRQARNHAVKFSTIKFPGKIVYRTYFYEVSAGSVKNLKKKTKLRKNTHVHAAV